MAHRTPFLVFSDGPRQPSGLARIARDLAHRLWLAQEANELPIQLVQCGYDPRPGMNSAWPVVNLGPLDTEGDWGASQVAEAYRLCFGNAEGVLFSVWDPGRAFSLLGVPDVQRWGYFPIDAANINNSIGGPAREAILRYDRVLAYGQWGSEVLSSIRRPIPYLPHGIDLDTWTYEQTVHSLGRAEEILQPREGEIIIGCVATNQSRKDLGLYFATLAELRHRGYKIRGWLHTDVLVRAWSVQQLIEDFGLARKVTVTTSLTDDELASCYSCCGATIAPGLGEGFCYPIVESLACGTPVAHGDYGGGVEHVPIPGWRPPIREVRLESVYALKRPVYRATDMANAIEIALDWKRNDHRTCQYYCRGSVQHLSWPRIWPRWSRWFTQGLEAM